VNVKSRRTQEACFAAAADIIVIQTDQHQTRKIQKPTEFGMCAMLIPSSTSLYSQWIFIL